MVESVGARQYTFNDICQILEKKVGWNSSWSVDVISKKV